MSLRLILLISLFGANTSHAVEARDVSSLESKNISSLITPSQLVVFTSPDCQACKRQLNDLDCLSPKIKVNVIAIDSKLSHARLEAAKHRNYSYYAMSSRTLSKVGLDNLVFPTLLYMNDKTINKVHGYNMCLKIKNMIEDHRRAGVYE